MKWRMFFLLVLAIDTTISRKYNDLQCHFLKSANITDGAVQPDDSVIYENVTYTKYADITYTRVNGSIELKTPKYRRGCIPDPEIKPFLRLHCPFELNGQDCPSYQNVRNLQQNVFYENGSQALVTLDHHFAFLFDEPCENPLDEPIHWKDEFNISYNGDISALLKGEDEEEDDSIDNYDINLYTLEFFRNYTTGEIETKLRICGHTPSDVQIASIVSDYRPTITIANMFISAILLTATFIVYLYLPDLDHFFGKMLMCYLSGPAISYFLIVLVKLIEISPESSVYETIGYIVFFAFMSSFAWVNVISFDLWKSFRTINVLTAFSQRKLLLLYMIYACGLAFFLTLLFHSLEPSKPPSNQEQSNVRLPICFLNTEDPSVDCLKYYIPIWCVFAVSQMFFTLTGVIVHSCCSDNEIRFKYDRQKSHINDGDNYSLHLRLHLATCLTWILKALALQYGLGGIGFYANISYTLQGLVIFVIFVMNRQVLHLMNKRWKNSIAQREAVNRTISIRSQLSYEALKPEAENLRDMDSKNTLGQVEPVKRPRTVSFRSHISHERIKGEAKSPWENKPVVFDRTAAIDELDAISQQRTASFRSQMSQGKQTSEEKYPWEREPWDFGCNNAFENVEPIKRPRIVSFRSHISHERAKGEAKSPWENKPLAFDRSAAIDELDAINRKRTDSILSHRSPNKSSTEVNYPWEKESWAFDPDECTKL